MAKEDFLKNTIKERMLEGLNINYLGYITNKEELTEENQKTLEYLNNGNMDLAIDKLIEHAKLELQMVGKIPGVKEILEIIDSLKARNFVVDMYKSTL